MNEDVAKVDWRIRAAKPTAAIGATVRLVAMLLSLCVPMGCVWFEEDMGKIDLGVAPVAHPLAKSAAYRGTIGAYTYFDGLRLMRVRGYGIVVGLGNNGSRGCPRPIYERLIRSVNKQHQFSDAYVGVKSITPEELISDLSTAVVVLQGEIPPGAVTGSRFDVFVSAIPGTQTKSLRGGRLFTAELHVYRPVSQTAAITGQVLAKGSGPVFLNPFSEGESATRTNPLEGTIVGGGTVLQDRRLRLVLSEPSYPRARQIQNRINAQFPGRRRIADAVSPSFVRLEVPSEFADDTGHFLALVRALYLSRDPKFTMTRVRLLANELLDESAPHAQIALALEGAGRTSIPVLNKLYGHPKDYVSFHAAAAGLRLGEHIACDAMVMHAQNAESPYRLQAIHALSRSTGIAGAGMTLRKLLDDGDPRIRIAAYEALFRRGDSVIQTSMIDEDNFRLDRIPSSAGRLIYVKRSGARRIALFGDHLSCTPPIFYRAPGGSLTLNADEGDESLTALRVVDASGTVSPPLSAPLDLAPLVRLLGSRANVGLDGEVLGLGLDYGAIVRALYHLSLDKSINAEFLLEQPSTPGLFDLPQTAGRPESEP